MTTFSEALLVLSSDFRVLFAGEEVRQLLGYNSEELVGNNFLVLCGPVTNIALLQTCMIDARLDRPATIQLVLYNRNLEKKRIMVRISAASQASAANFSFRLSTSNAILLSDAIAGWNRHPRVITSTYPPYLISIFNDIFSTTFGIDKDHQQKLLSLPISVVASPRIDVCAWTRTFFSSTEGYVDESTVYTKTTFCADYPFKLRCEPVVLSENGKIAFISATFLSLAPEIKPHDQSSVPWFGNMPSRSSILCFISHLPIAPCHEHSLAFELDPLQPYHFLGSQEPEISSSTPARVRLGTSDLQGGASDLQGGPSDSGCGASDGLAAGISNTAPAHGHFPPAVTGDSDDPQRHRPAPQAPPRRRAGRPQRGDDVAALLVRGDHTLLRRIRRRHAAADRRAAMLGGEGAAVPRP